MSAVYFLIAYGFIASPPIQAKELETWSPSQLSETLRVGDIIFVRIPILPFKKIAQDTGSWTNHVGIITRNEDGELVVSESTFPLSRGTQIDHFIARSEQGRVAIMRLNSPLTEDQKKRLMQAAEKRYGILYDTGFNLYSRRQFCSRFVYEVVKEATNIGVGEVETLESLFKENPNADLTFWRTWYLGFIPWERKTVTPASVLNSKHLHSLFDGYVVSDG